MVIGFLFTSQLSRALSLYFLLLLMELIDFKRSKKWFSQGREKNYVYFLVNDPKAVQKKVARIIEVYSQKKLLYVLLLFVVMVSSILKCLLL